jgi:type IV pilus assembly protein PilQ
MDIITNKDEPDFTRTVRGNPTVITKYAKTNVVVFDGQTTVIGGLNQQTDRGSTMVYPGLERFPGLGYLFKGESKNRNQLDDLLIFITPHILKRRSRLTAPDHRSRRLRFNNDPRADRALVTIPTPPLNT